MSRVLVLVPFAIDAAGVARRAEQQHEVSLRDDVTYEYRTVRAGPTSFVSPHDWLLLDLAILDAGLGAQDEGFDAVVIDTVSDSGADALRSMLDIPVIAPGRASLIFALTLGRRFGVMAQWEPALARYEKVLDDWGLRDRCAGVEHFDIDLNPDAKNWYLRVPHPDRAYEATIGLITRGGTFYPFAKSERVQTPRATASDIVDDAWNGTPAEADEIYRLSGGHVTLSLIHI